MNMFDEARALQGTIKMCGITQEEIAKKLNVSQSVVINRWRKAALNVAGVTDCEPIPEYDSEGRIIGGRIYATTINGTQVQVEV